MNKSLIKISCALAIISIYTYVFGVMDIVGEVPLYAEDLTQGADRSDSDNSGDSSNSDNPDSDNLSNSASLVSANRRMPQLSDYDSPVPPAAVDFSMPDNFADSDNPDNDSAENPPENQPENFEEVDSTKDESEIIDFPELIAPTPTTAPVITAAPIATTTTTTTNSQNPVNPPTNPANKETFKVMSGGVVHEGDAFDIITRIVQNEIGSSFHKDAIKAQTVASYTYIKQQNEAGVTPNILLADSASDRVKECAREVWGQAIYYNGELIQAVFSASTAGYSSSAKNVWGQDLPYLQSVNCDFDRQYDRNRNVEVTFSSSEIAATIQRQTGITLTGEPSQWFKILSMVDSVYVGNMSIGGKTTYKKDGREITITGRDFREKIMGFSLKSASFSIVYSKDKDLFTFTTDGYGHGAGMSQNGANILATHKGYDYVAILKHYYTSV